MIEYFYLLIDFFVSFFMLFLNVKVVDDITVGMIGCFMAVLFILLRLIFFRKMGED